MVTYEDLCMDVKEIGERHNIEYEVFPMRDYSYKDGERAKGKITEMRITFRITSLDSHRAYTYSIAPWMWKQFQKDDNAYNEFIQYLGNLVRRSLLYSL